MSRDNETNFTIEKSFSAGGDAPARWQKISGHSFPPVTRGRIRGRLGGRYVYGLRIQGLDRGNRNKADKEVQAKGKKTIGIKIKQQEDEGRRPMAKKEKGWQRACFSEMQVTRSKQSVMKGYVTNQSTRREKTLREKKILKTGGGNSPRLARGQTVQRKVQFSRELESQRFEWMKNASRRQRKLDDLGGKGSGRKIISACNIWGAGRVETGGTDWDKFGRAV